VAQSLGRDKLSTIPYEHRADLWVGENLLWADYWGWCVREDHRMELPKENSRADCLIACDQQTWNGLLPSGCEYSTTYGQCVAFFGKDVTSSQRGSNFRCNKAFAKQKDFRDNMNGLVGSYRNACNPQDEARGCTVSTKWGPSGYSTCTCSAITAFFECNTNYVSSGVGSVTRDSFEGCIERFKNTGKKFVYYAGSQHCQETKLDNTHKNNGWKVCVPLKNSDADAAAITMRKAESGSSTKDLLVHGFAAIGLAATLFGAFRFYTSK